MIPRSALLREKAVVLRTVGQFNEFGEWEAGQPSETVVDCVSSPDTGAERVLDQTGESRQGRRYFWLRTTVDISIGKGGTGANTADRIRYPVGPSGEMFRVIELARFPKSHIRALAERVVPGG